MAVPDDYPKVYLYRRVVQAKLFIDANAGEKIDLDNISGEASFSKFHFVRLFKNIYGMTPHQYLIHARIAQAKLLIDKGTSVSETCYKVGFESLSSFSGLFKKIVGMTASEYQSGRKRVRQEIETRPLKFVPNCFAEAKGWTRLELNKSNFEEMKEE